MTEYSWKRFYLNTLTTTPTQVFWWSHNFCICNNDLGNVHTQPCHKKHPMHFEKIILALHLCLEIYLMNKYETCDISQIYYQCSKNLSKYLHCYITHMPRFARFLGWAGRLIEKKPLDLSYDMLSRDTGPSVAK